jgi:hypothetical protein
VPELTSMVAGHSTAQLEVNIGHSGAGMAAGDKASLDIFWLRDESLAEVPGAVEGSTGQ